VRRYNSAVVASGQSQPETIDAAQVAREMLAAQANPGALTDRQRADLLARYNRLAGQQSTARADSPDLAERMEAARQAQERGEQVDVAALMGQFEAWQSEQLQAARDPANLPPELQEAAKVIYAAEAEMHRPADPVRAAVDDLNAYVRSMRLPTLDE
jgi:predicted  nucleic acid-binding Zn-ribbon protein